MLAGIAAAVLSIAPGRATATTSLTPPGTVGAEVWAPRVVLAGAIRERMAASEEPRSPRRTFSLALASQTGDDATVTGVLDTTANPLCADRAVDHALRPDNDGDGRGTTPAPEVAILRRYRPERGGTVDYMTCVDVPGEVLRAGRGTLTQPR